MHAIHTTKTEISAHFLFVKITVKVDSKGMRKIHIEVCKIFDENKSQPFGDGSSCYPFQEFFNFKFLPNWFMALDFYAKKVLKAFEEFLHLQFMPCDERQR